MNCGPTIGCNTHHYSISPNTQNPVLATECGFDSLHRHQHLGAFSQLNSGPQFIVRSAILLLVLCASSCNAAPTPLFTNNVPADTTGATYLAGVQAIANAMNNGQHIHISMTFPENGATAYFYVDSATAKCSVGFPGSPSTITDPNPAGTLDYCSAIINMRPRIDPQADVVGTNVMIGGSVDTLGRYWYVGPTGVLQIQGTYATTWWAD